MIDLLVLAICCVCWLSRDDGAVFWPLLIFCIPTLFYMILPPEGANAFLIGGAVDVGILFTLNMLSKVNYTVKVLACASLILLCLNFTGWAMYEMWYEPDLYNQACLALYAIVLLMIMDNGYGLRSDSYRTSVSRFMHNRR